MARAMRRIDKHNRVAAPAKDDYAQYGTRGGFQRWAQEYCRARLMAALMEREAEYMARTAPLRRRLRRAMEAG